MICTRIEPVVLIEALVAPWWYPLKHQSPRPPSRPAVSRLNGVAGVLFPMVDLMGRSLTSD